ncbi:hypothetical protein BGZ52_007467, partial [Haplosporangium bisporale]
MKEIQSFRVADSTTNIVNFDVDNVDGQNVIYWEDIKQAFPGVQYIRNGSTVVKFLRDLNHTRILPHCIMHCPGVVLDVVNHVPVDSSMAISILIPTYGRADTPIYAQTGAALSNPPANIPTDISNDIPTNHSSDSSANEEVVCGLEVAPAPAEAYVYHVTSTILEEQYSLLSKDVSEIKAALVKNTELAVHNAELAAHNVELATRGIELQEVLNAKQEEMKQLQVSTLNQMAMLQSRVQAVLTQTFELHEYPIPRLFVVLPQNPSGWDTVNPFSNKLRLYFLCECEEHTQSNNSKASALNHIHIAKHEGYEIARPSDFFQQYGTYVLTMLKMLKFGISVAGVAIPAFSHLVQTDAINQASSCLEKLQANIEPGMDHIIEWMDVVSVNDGAANDQFGMQMEKKEALEGADLRKLVTFLKGKDESKVLGNLYRTVTDEGHVKWVCLDHYRVNYQETTAKEFQRLLNDVGGSFDEHNGLVRVELQSRLLAERFYSALGKARSVYELELTFNWACTSGDLEALEDALKLSRVSILR